MIITLDTGQQVEWTGTLAPTEDELRKLTGLIGYSKGRTPCGGCKKKQQLLLDKATK